MYVDRYMEQVEKYKGKRRTRRDAEEILASARGKKLETWAEKDGKWDMAVAQELIMQDLEMDKAPLGADGKKMTAAERDDWVHSKFDSFDEAAREDLRDRILKGTAAKKLQKKEAKELKDSGGAAEGSAAKPKQKRAKRAAVEPESQ